MTNIYVSLSPDQVDILQTVLQDEIQYCSDLIKANISQDSNDSATMKLTAISDILNQLEQIKADQIEACCVECEQMLEEMGYNSDSDYIHEIASTWVERCYMTVDCQYRPVSYEWLQTVAPVWGLEIREERL